MGKYSVKPKPSKWTVAAFSYMLDVARVSATTISMLNQKASPKYLFSTVSINFINLKHLFYAFKNLL